MFRATAEHLLARSEGGADCPGNVVAACWYCNSHRHRARSPLSPEKYAEKVRAKRQWDVGISSRYHRIPNDPPLNGSFPRGHLKGVTYRCFRLASSNHRRRCRSTRPSA
ncbi:MAG: hypothetical protein HKO08_03355 [Erythrobacter sp.]|nr:hypothetical protein [Erythrobacter sp.]